MTRHVILGAGPAGVIAAETIRKHAPGDEIVIVGDEPEPPYSRMAISYLLNESIGEEGTYLRHGRDHYAALRIEIKRGVRASAVDVGKKTVTLGDGSSLSYDRLLIATGSTPALPPIPGVKQTGVYPCWTLADAREIARRAGKGARVVQMGAGFIGCIIMDPLIARGVDLTVVEMGDRMVPRMMGPTAGGMIKRWVEGKGVRVLTGTKVEAIESGAASIASPAALAPAAPSAPAVQSSSGGGFLAWLWRLIARLFGSAADDAAPVATGSGAPSCAGARAPLRVRLSSGQTLDADLVICSTGVKPQIGFLENSAIKCLLGVLTDEHMQTSVPGVFAAGDCAEAFDKVTGKTLVSAIQPNAAEQARVAALNMIGQKAVLRGVTQINVLDTLGLVSASFGEWQGVPGGEHVELTDEAAHKHLSLQFNGDRMAGCNAIGWTEHIGVMRGLVEGQVKLAAGWKQRLMKDPTLLMEAYLASAQAQEHKSLVKG